MAKVLAGNSASKRRPAIMPDSREQQIISMAYDLVEKRIREGTASSQETTHFLKLGSSKARIEKETLELQKELIAAKTKALRDQEEMKELYAEALKAMRNYAGQGDPDEY